MLFRFKSPYFTSKISSVDQINGSYSIISFFYFISLSLSLSLFLSLKSSHFIGDAIRLEFSITNNESLAEEQIIVSAQQSLALNNRQSKSKNSLWSSVSKNEKKKIDTHMIARWYWFDFFLFQPFACCIEFSSHIRAYRKSTRQLDYNCCWICQRCFCILSTTTHLIMRPVTE